MRRCALCTHLFMHALALNSYEQGWADCSAQPCFFVPAHTHWAVSCRRADASTRTTAPPCQHPHKHPFLHRRAAVPMRAPATATTSAHIAAPAPATAITSARAVPRHRAAARTHARVLARSKAVRSRFLWRHVPHELRHHVPHGVPFRTTAQFRATSTDTFPTCCIPLYIL